VKWEEADPTFLTEGAPQVCKRLFFFPLTKKKKKLEDSVIG